MKKQMFISFFNGSYFIYATGEDGVSYPYQQYTWYSKKEAIKKFRDKYGLRHQHFVLNEIDFCSGNYGFMY